MKRRAILIFNDGGPGNYLPGVKIDKNNYLGFLRSAEGGAWEDNEITVYDNDCTKFSLLNYIKTHRCAAESVGYWLIIFSGHGYSTATGEIFLELSPNNDCSIEEIKKATDCSRRLLIADSCRSVIHLIQDSLTRERRLFSSTTAEVDYRTRCRELYMKQLKEVFSNTFNAAYAAEFGQSAKDDDSTGGYYSSELLKAAKTAIVKAKDNNRYVDSVVVFKTLHDEARNAVIRRSSGSQNPSSEGSYLETIPFVVVPKA